MPNFNYMINQVGHVFLGHMEQGTQCGLLSQNPNPGAAAPQL